MVMTINFITYKINLIFFLTDFCLDFQKFSLFIADWYLNN